MKSTIKTYRAVAGLVMLLMGAHNGVRADAPTVVGAYQSGTYRNALTEQAGIPPAAVQGRIDSAFRQLFYGDNETERLYFPVGEDMAFIEDIPNNDVRTEGMSYGMMIAVQLDKKQEFDHLWKWTKAHMYMAKGPHRGYFAWHCRPDGSVLDSTAASDGEEWFVTALFFASARWGEGKGIFAYRAEAERVLHTMLHKEEEPDHGHVTNMFHAKEKLVAFVPDAGANHFTDPSYQLPHFYTLWAQWAPADKAFWNEAAAASRDLLRKSAHPKTGLSPDYCSYSGIPEQFFGGGHDEFRFDAWRVAMNVAVDWSWFAADSWAVSQSNRLLRFFASKGIKTFGNQFSLDGKARLGNDHSAGLVAALAVAATAASNPIRAEFLHELWRTPIPRGHYRYYDGMLYLLGLLQASGNFRIYSPQRDANHSSHSDSAPRIRLAADGKGSPLSSSGVSIPFRACGKDHPGAVLEKVVADCGAAKPSVLVLPVSFRRKR